MTARKAPEVEPAASSGAAGRFRWLICLLLFVITVNNYMDRQVLSIAAPAIAAQFSMSNSDIAVIANAFLLSYTFGQLFSGIFVDWLGARNGFSLAVLAWSFTGMLTSLARQVFSFSLCRLVLGLSESANYPGGTKVCAEWFPPQELATAVGIFQSGSSIGATLTPPIAAFLIGRYGWQAAFVVVAFPGFLWLPLWRRFYRPMETHPDLGRAERDYIQGGKSTTRIAGEGQFIRWTFFLRQRKVWGVVLGRFFEEPVGWFYFTWLPLYLQNYRHLALSQIGILLTIPYLTLDAGKIGGGYISSLLIKRGWCLDRSRKTVLSVGVVCLASSLLAVAAGTPLGFIMLISIATFGHGCWATASQTVPGDLVADRWVGTVYGITACGGGLGAIIFMQATGKLVDISHSFNTPLILAGLLPMLGLAAFMLVTGKIEPLHLPDARAHDPLN